MRKLLIITFINSFFHSFLLGQYVNKMDSIKTRIYIIGVVHSENKYRNSDSLLNILKDLKPDLILDESDSTTSFFPRQYLLSKPPWWYIVGRKLSLLRKMPPEVEVLFKYKKIDSNIKILPFDKKINNKKRFMKLYLKSERKWYSFLNSAFANGLIPDSLTNVHETYMKYNNWLHNTFNKGYKEINNPNVIDSVRQFQMIEEKYISDLITRDALFSKFKTWLPIYKDFWFVRNTTMSKNIIKMAENAKARKVVVFTGLLHKYSLTDSLNSYNTGWKFELIEYFEK